MSAGKGDKPRPVDGEKYRSNYDKIYNKSKPEANDCRIFIPTIIDSQSTERISWKACEALIGTFGTTLETEDSSVMEDESGNCRIANKANLDRINFK